MIIKFYKEEDSKKWDEFVKISFNGTFLHERKFLSYHKDRFLDKSIIIYDDKSKIIALFPAAISDNNKKVIISHPGITYGGIITNKLYGEDIIDVLKNIIEFYNKQGYEKIIYKSIPYIYHKKFSQDDLYALFRINANRIRVDLSATINLKSEMKLRKGTKWMINKGKKSGLKIFEGDENLEGFWRILTENLEDKYGTKPVHSIDEMRLLLNRFKNEIKCLVCKKDNEVLAGMIIFNMNNLYHTQYIANNSTAKDYGALEYLISFAIEKSKIEGKDYFDFGTNNENQGRYLNQSLYQFKKGFNAGGVVYETYQLDIKNTY